VQFAEAGRLIQVGVGKPGDAQRIVCRGSFI
jgi:hypothetical protein